MSTVVPNGQIRFFTGVPIDDTYENTLYFDNVSQQTSYFLGLTPVHRMMGATRVRDGVIKVNALSDTILTCNYMMFQNTGFSNKWFYAFIDNVRYANNGMSYVYYHLDDIQTWLFDTQLRQCYIERQHSTSDGIYSNLIPENVGAPEYTNCEELVSHGFSDDMDAVLFTSVEQTEGEWGTSAMHCINGLLGCYTPTVLAEEYILDGDVRSAAWEVFDAVVQDIIADNKADSIIGGVIMPHEFMNGSIHDSGESSSGDTKRVPMSNMSGTIDGYSPKNNKLFNAPYCVVRIRMSDGQCVYLQPQYIDGNYITWREITVTSMTPELAIIPMNYKGQDFDYEGYISFSKFPQFSIAVDGYKAWVASGGLATAELSLSQTQRAGDLSIKEAGTKGAIKSMKGLGKAGGGAVSAYYTGGIEGVDDILEGTTEVAEAVIDAEFTKLKIEQNVQFASENFDLKNAIAKSLPPTQRGNSIGNALATGRKIGYTVDKLTINSDMAKSIDDYFTMFGYAQNIIAVPNRKARPHYTYIKTMGCKIDGGAPSDALTRIKAIYDKGIRFWVNASEVGNYSVDNSPV